MALQSALLAGSARLEQAASGGPSLRPAPPADDVDAVRRIQKALVRLGQPMPRSFPNGPDAEPDGSYGDETRRAVIAFQQRVFPGRPQEWDGRVGRKTIAEMDRALPATPTPPPAPVPTAALVADVVVRFVGGTISAPLDAGSVLGRSRLVGFARMPDQEFGDKVLFNATTGRALVRIGRTTNTIGPASFQAFGAVLAELTGILAKIKAQTGRIMVHGSSSGGRNAADFAAQLIRGGFPVHLVSMVDAAFFPDETATRPEGAVEHPSTVPVFFVPAIGATLRHNFFQTVGNHTKRTLLHGVLFTSHMKAADGDDTQEIHGEVSGFTNHNVNAMVDANASDDIAHVSGSTEGNRETERLISEELLKP